MSLWTPDGERPVQREPQPAADPATAAAGGGLDPSMLPPGMAEELAALSPEDRARAEAVLMEMAEVQQRIAQAPAADVVANHLMGIYELGAIHLQQDPPHFAEASVAIDALRAVVEGLKGRLGEHEPTLAEALQQLQMAFVQLKDQHT